MFALCSVLRAKLLARAQSTALLVSLGRMTTSCCAAMNLARLFEECRAWVAYISTSTQRDDYDGGGLRCIGTRRGHEGWKVKVGVANEQRWARSLGEARDQAWRHRGAAMLIASSPDT